MPVLEDTVEDEGGMVAGEKKAFVEVPVRIAHLAAAGDEQDLDSLLRAGDDEAEEEVAVERALEEDEDDGASLYSAYRPRSSFPTIHATRG